VRSVTNSGWIMWKAAHWYALRITANDMFLQDWEDKNGKAISRESLVNSQEL
jgi:hypothetical protein